MKHEEFKKYADKLLFVPLGGSNEIGMNLNLYHYDGKWLMVDLGIGFADAYLPGVDIIVPDVSFIADIRDDLLGIVLTHAHEDHLGAVPYLWDELRCPLYATAFTAGVLKAKIAGMGGKPMQIHEVKPGVPFDLGPFSVEMVPLTHSIPEMQALAIRTPKGTVMHTGDWKFDADPLVGPVSDEETLAKYGDEGILAMICDSTNVFVEGHSGSEGDVRHALVNLIQECKGRVAVATFASNIARIESIIRAGQEAGRQIALVGRSLWRITEVAREAGYLEGVPPFLTDKDAMDLPPGEVLIMCTGCQGESKAALARIATGDHPVVSLSRGDSVILSSRVIPGNETRVFWLLNKLVLKGVEILTEKDHFIHVSGHPAREELSRMYQLVRPKIAVPVHGEPRHLHEHCKFARNHQVEQAVEAKNGAVIMLEPGDARMVGEVKSGYVAIDGNTLIPTQSPVIKLRRKLQDAGGIFVTLALDSGARPVAAPKFSAPGALDPNLDGDLFDLLEEEVANVLADVTRKAGNKEIEDKVRQSVKRIFKRELDKKPIVEVHVIRV